MTFMRKGLLSGIVVLMLSGCVSSPPKDVEGSVPEQKLKMVHYYPGQPKQKEETALLVCTQYQDQTQLFITSIDGFSPNKKTGLIGGDKAAIVLPGAHDVHLQLHDKGRLTIPIVLPKVKVQANTAYVINFEVNYPQDNSYGFDSALNTRIKVVVSELETKKLVYMREMNGMGK